LIKNNPVTFNIKSYFPVEIEKTHIKSSKKHGRQKCVRRKNL